MKNFHEMEIKSFIINEGNSKLRSIHQRDECVFI